MNNQQSTGLMGWIDARFPLSKMMREHLSEYYAPKNFNFWYFFGSLALLVLVIQILTGIFLTMHYKPDAELAFASVEHIMRDVNWGWLIRYMHSTGASFFFIVVYLHMFRALMYGSYKSPRELIWIFGMFIYVALMAEAFMGYLLPWGNMSYWGAQVIINLFNTIPFIGEGLSEWIRGDFVISDATLNRFFSLHVIAVPLALLGLIVGHILALHEVGSNNPDGVEIKKTKGSDGIPLDGIPFHPYYTVKDILGAVVFLAIFAFVVFFMPEMNGYFLEHANFDPANALNTPDHIAPIWYFTPFYTVLRAVPNPFGGFAMMGLAIIVLFFLPWIDRNPIKSIRYRSLLFKINLILFAITFVILGYLGLKPVTPLYSELALRFTEVYFLFFFVMWAYSKSRSGGFWIGSFIVLLGGITLYDFLRLESVENTSLIWMTWLIPAGYLFITLVMSKISNWDAEKQVPDRVTGVAGNNMKIINTSIFVITLLALSIVPAWAAGGGGSDLNLGDVKVQVSNTASLQRGAKYFMNYCLGCHTAQHARYKRIAEDLQIREDLMIENMIFTDQKIGELISVAMKREDAKEWFLGVDPPDLSTYARVIGPQAIYNFLMSFYVDDSRPFGVNNLHLNNTAMPHVLVGLQGLQRAEFKIESDGHGGEQEKFEKFELIQPGKLSEEEYTQVVTDIVNFLVYLAEPVQLVRKQIGTWVLLFLGLLALLAYFLKKNYWQDIH